MGPGTGGASPKGWIPGPHFYMAGRYDLIGAAIMKGAQEEWGAGPETIPTHPRRGDGEPLINL
ncbi:MAG: hypothetical protein METHAR1v1_560027 [Methanothrix sp.]|nr:MAG: hypothetical protein METHAR1v1_560027 [Methanothrix sp.]